MQQFVELSTTHLTPIGWSPTRVKLKKNPNIYTHIYFIDCDSRGEKRPTKFVPFVSHQSLATFHCVRGYLFFFFATRHFITLDGLFLRIENWFTTNRLPVHTTHTDTLVAHQTLNRCEHKKLINLFFLHDYTLPTNTLNEEATWKRSNRARDRCTEKRKIFLHHSGFEWIYLAMP